MKIISPFIGAVIFAILLASGLRKVESSNAVFTDMETEIKEIMPEITDIIIGERDSIALCADGSVWSRDDTIKGGPENNTDSFKRIAGLENIIKIMDMGTVRYALSSEGNIYEWESSEYHSAGMDEERDNIFYEPVRQRGISKITDMDARNGKVFAVDKEGNLYAWGWGLCLYNNDYEDMNPGFPEKSRGLVKNVKKIFIGSGEYHYFLREDGSIFSIMGSPLDLTYVDAFIFPDFNEAYQEQYFDVPPASAVRIDEGSKMGKTILYEMGSGEEIRLIGADDYTVFVYKEDGTLWYWDSDRIKYHDCKAALANTESKVNYGGEFKEIEYEKILDSSYVPAVMEICAGKENTLFLMENGQVFMSEYITTEVKDIEYYNRANTRADRTVFTSVKPNMELKALSFRRLDYEDIVRINTDGEYHFSLIDKNGDYFALSIQ